MFVRRKSIKHIVKFNNGFSLVELLVVVAILAILAAIAIPLFLNQKNKALDAVTRSDVRNLATEVESTKTPSGTFLQDGSEWAALGATVTPSKGVGMGYILNCAFTVSGGVPTFIASPGNYVIWGYAKQKGVWAGLPGTVVIWYTSLNGTWHSQTNGAATPACNGSWQNASWDGNP